MADSWDKFVDSAKDFAGTVAGAAGDFYGKSKEYFNIKRLEYQLREKYRQLGRLQYKIEIGEDISSADKEELIADITELYEEIKRNNGKEQQYDYTTCESCSSVIPNDAKFCPGCGEEL